MKTKIHLEDFDAVYDDSLHLRKEVFEKILEFIVEHKCFFPESAMQNDNPQIYAPQLIAEIVELINFSIEEK